MPASASQIGAPPRPRAPARLLPGVALLVCSAAAIVFGPSPRRGAPEPALAVASLQPESAPQGKVEVERFEVRNDELIVSGPHSIMARRLVATPKDAGTSAAVLVELSGDPGYEAWRRAYGRALEQHLDIVRYEGSGRTFLRAALSGPDLPPVDSLFEVRDGHLTPLASP